MEHLDYKQYQKLGPFEIKDFVAKVAMKSAEDSSLTFLNAGRGNPNWVATEPREAFFLLGQFAITESKRVFDLPPGVGGMPKAKGIAGRLDAWLTKHQDMPGAPFLQRMAPWTVKKFGFDADQFIHELVHSIIGDHYPVPDRMLVHNEQIVHEYLKWAMCGEPYPKGTVQDLRGRGRHRRHVLHLQVAEEQSPPEPGRHHRDGRADLHAVPGDGAPRRLRPALRARSTRSRNTSSSIRMRRSTSCSIRRSRRSSSSIPAIPSRWRCRPPPSTRSARC